MKPPVYTEIEALLADKKRSLIEIYLDIQRLGEKHYGQHTIVMMEVGTFFEVYGIDNSAVRVGKPKEVAELLNVQLTRKNKAIVENSIENPLLAGFPSVSFDRYISRIVQEQKYTVIVVRQRGVLPNISRYLDCILSPGVNFEFALDHDDNFISSVVVDCNKGVYSAGYAAVDVTTGKTFVLEVAGTTDDPTYALDELFSLVQTHRTSEFLLTCVSDAVVPQDVLDYLEVQTPNVKVNTKRLNVVYQNALFKHAYAIESMLSPIEFLDLERMPLTSESLALLLEFVIEHDYKVTQSLSRPMILDTQAFLYLGNNPLEQLNIISRDPYELTVWKLLDYTSTAIGKRLFKERLLNPITSPSELHERYELAEKLRPVHEKMETELKSIYDIERLLRRIQLDRLHPFEMNFLYDSLVATNHMIEHVKAEAMTILPEFVSEQNSVQDAITTIGEVFDLNETVKAASTGIEHSFFQREFHAQLDELISQKEQLEAKLDLIRVKILELLHQHTDKVSDDYVVIKQLDKEGHYISITKSRYSLIQKPIKELMLSIDGTVYAFADFTFKVQTSNVKVTADVMDKISAEIVVLQNKIAALVKELFIEQLHALNSEYSELLKRLIVSIGRIDVAVSTIKAAEKLHLVRPKIVKTGERESLLELTQVRHLLVEAREDSGIYVPNDVRFSNVSGAENVHGMLLYGINSSGKSSLMKSVGICVVLAQSGFFVPAESMRFSIMTELFTRIIAKDNLEKGLSSFAVEMLELKNILNRCSANSLIIGDEISHGTETLSAISIVSATILRLAEIKSIFMFATHLHQLNSIQEIQRLKNIVSMHLSVHYDDTKDKLIFDRTLQPGSGSSIYGLEFAKSLHMDQAFLDYALDVRKRLANQYEDLELITQQQRSKYNPNLLMTHCAVCKNPVEDTHHINEQHKADEKGFINHIPKDHKFNLIPLCKSCHQKVHAGKLKIEGFKMTSNGLELQYQEQ